MVLAAELAQGQERRGLHRLRGLAEVPEAGEPPGAGRVREILAAVPGRAAGVFHGFTVASWSRE